MQIRNGLLTSAAYKPARTIGNALDRVRAIVIHDTAGRLDKFSSVRWFQDPKCKVSAHFVIERDGTVTQCVPVNRRALHAGESSWTFETGETVRYLNSCSIGIEIVSPGVMDQTGKAWFGPAAAFDEITHRTTSDHGQGWWMPYTEAQIAAVILLCTLLVEEYPDCNEILGHWQISPGRKVDPNPLFPWDRVRDSVLDGKATARVPVGDAGETHDDSRPPAEAAGLGPQGKTLITEAAITVKAGSGIEMATETTRAVAKLNGTGKAWGTADVLLILAQSPTFWISLTMFVSALLIYARRAAQKRSP